MASRKKRSYHYFRKRARDAYAKSDLKKLVDCRKLVKKYEKYLRI